MMPLSNLGVTQMQPQQQEPEDDGCESRWANMVPDALVNIFARLSLEERMCIVPSVCRSWRRIYEDPVCWQKVDLEEWSYYETDEKLHRMAELLVNKAHGRITHFRVPYLKSAHMLLASSTSASALQVLQINRNMLSEDTLCQLASKFCSICFLDISYCASLSKCSLEAFGRSCPQITCLILNMNPQNLEPNDDIALTVSKYMQQVEHLEIVFGALSNTGLKALFENCKSLEYLDLRGCWFVDMDEPCVQEASKRLRVFHKPEVEDAIYDRDMYDLGAYSEDTMDSRDMDDLDSDFEKYEGVDYQGVDISWDGNSEDGTIW